ncbi:hypothetical protein ACFOYU_21715 [Microvirga sp. GCM10011540]|uniref:hypothetical protein n=1 Tax=Microvirga sp. GCM10011540 TaxID=3317338 RepID=UPI00362463CB
MTHRYAVGERVLYTQRLFPNLTWKAPYTITRCLTADSVEPQYRIHSVLRSDERLAGEHELTRFAQPQQAFRAGASDPVDCIGPDAAANLNLIPSDLRRRAWHKNERFVRAGR